MKAGSDAKAGERPPKSIRSILEACRDSCSRGIRSCTTYYNKIYAVDRNLDLLGKIERTHRSLFELSKIFPPLLKAARVDWEEVDIAPGGGDPITRLQGPQATRTFRLSLVCLLHELVQGAWAASSASYACLLCLSRAGFSGSAWLQRPYGDVTLVRLSYDAHYLFRTTCEKLVVVLDELMGATLRKINIADAEHKVETSAMLRRSWENFERHLSALQKESGRLQAEGTELKGYLEGIARARISAEKKG